MPNLTKVEFKDLVNKIRTIDQRPVKKEFYEEIKSLSTAYGTSRLDIMDALDWSRSTLDALGIVDVTLPPVVDPDA